MFELNEFLSQAVDPLPTNYENVPEGDFPFMIDSGPDQLKPQEVSGVSEKTGQPYKFFTIELDCICQDPKVNQKLNRDKVTVRLRLNLDFTPEGRLDTGINKNVMLGKLRAALGQNDPGWVPTRLLGAGPFMGRVTHRADKKNPEIKYAEISQVTAMRH